jgi:hypothetical protein
LLVCGTVGEAGISFGGAISIVLLGCEQALKVGMASHEIVLDAYKVGLHRVGEVENSSLLSSLYVCRVCTSSWTDYSSSKPVQPDNTPLRHDSSKGFLKGRDLLAKPYSW